VSWPNIRIGDWGEVIGGRQRSPKITSGEQKPYLRVANVFDGVIKTEDVLCMPFTDKEFKKYGLVPGDILLNEGQSIELVGRSSLYELEPYRYAFQNTLVRFRAGPNCDPRYAQLLFQELRRRRRFQAIATKTTSIAHLGVNRFADLVVAQPPLAHQIAVANLGGSFDTTIQTTEALLAAKREQKRGLMQELLTGRRRFPGFGGDGNREACRLYGCKPTDWANIPLNELCQGITRKNKASECDLVLTVSGARGMVDQREYFTKNVAGENRDGYFLLDNGEFAYNRSRMKGYRYGAIKRLDDYERGVLSTLNICFGLSTNEIQSDYLVHLFEAQLLDRQLRRITQEGARAHGLLNVTKTDFLNIKILTPPIEEQAKISECLTQADTEIAHLESLAEQLREQKRGLMQRLFSGDLDLSKLSADPATTSKVLA